MNPRVLMVQTGYLAIKSVSEDGKIAGLGWPNREVAQAMADFFADEMMGRSYDSAGILHRMYGALSAGDIDRLAEAFNDMLLCAGPEKHPSRSEASLRTAIRLALASCGLAPFSEAAGPPGDSAIETVAGRYRWVLEFKVAGSSPEIQSKLLEGIARMKERQSGPVQDGEKLLRAVMVCSAEERRFAAWQLVDGA